MDQLLRQNGSDPFDQAAAEVPLDPFDRGRRHRLHGRRLELQTVFLVPDPLAVRDQPFPGGHGRQRSDNRRLLTMSLCFYAEDTEAVFFVVESDALDDGGDFLSRGPAFRDCGIHAWGFIFPWTAGACVTRLEGDLHQFGRPEGFRVGSSERRKAAFWATLAGTTACCTPSLRDRQLR